jgi:hypothetical protein
MAAKYRSGVVLETAFIPPSPVRGFLDMRNAAGVHGFNIRVSSEVLVVERQNVLDAMHQHWRHQARVVNLYARDAMSYQKSAPLFVNRKAVREQMELFLEKPCPAVCVLRRKAVAIAIHGASTGIPKFRNILGRIAENAVTPQNGIDG